MLRTLIAVVAVVAVACGGPAETGADGEVGSTEPSGQATPSAASSSETKVVCRQAPYDPGTFDELPGVDALAQGPANATDDAGAPAFDPSLDWRIVAQTETSVEMVRELPEPQGEGVDVRTHEGIVILRMDDATNVPAGTWLLMSAGTCAPRVVSDPALGEADLALRDASPDATTLELDVYERACASAQSAEGRVVLVDLEETAEQVRLHIGVEPLGGAQNCPGNPPTPFTVELDAPLGDREVVDMSVVPARPLPDAEGGS